MMLDSKLIMSEAQAITATADSTNEIDFGAADLNIGQGNPLFIEVWLDTAFSSTVNTLTVSLASSADGATYNAVDTIVILPATATSALGTPGQLVKLSLLENTKRYLKLIYTVSTTLADGKVNAFITIG